MPNSLNYKKNGVVRPFCHIEQISIHAPIYSSVNNNDLKYLVYCFQKDMDSYWKNKT